MANYESSYTGAQIDSAVEKIVDNDATAGKVLTSDGEGGSSYEPLYTAGYGITITNKVIAVSIPNANGVSF